MADGVEVGRAFVSIATSTNASEIAKKGQQAAAAFVKGFSGVAKAGLSTIEGKAVSAQHALGFVASAGTKSFAALSNAASNTQKVLTSVHSGIMKIGSTAATAGLVVPRAFGMMSEGARHLSNEIGLSSFRLQMMGGVLTSVVTAPLLLATKAIATFGLTTAMSLEDAQVALAALLPPGYDVEALILRLQALAISSPVFAIDQLENFTKRLVGAGVPISQAEQLLDSLNKIMITFGVTGENASMVLLGVQQVFQKGKVQSEELTRQISQQLPIWNLLSQASGKTQQELLEMSVAGEFTSQMFADMLVQVGNLPSIMKGAAGGVKTLSSQLSILKETFQQKIGLAFLDEFGSFKTFLEALQPIINEFTDLVIKAIPIAVDYLGKAVNGVYLLRTAFLHLEPETQKLLIQIAKIAPVVGPALLIIGALASSLSALLGIFAFAIHPITIFVGLLAYAAQTLYKTSEDFRNGVEAFRSSFVQAFSSEMPGAMQQFNAAIQNSLIPALADLARAFGFTTWTDFGTWLGQTLPKLMVRAVTELVTAVSLITKAVNFLSSEWVKLDENTKKNILRFTALGIVLVPLLPVLAGVAGAIATIAKVLAILTSVNSLALFGILALAAGIRYLWLNSETFRASILAFSDAFKRSWVAVMLPAIAAFKQAVMTDLIPALIGAGKALGFTTWVDFATFMGGALPKLMAKAVKAVTIAIGGIADAVRYLTGVWAGLSEQQKLTVTKIIGLTIILLPFLPLLGAIAGAVSGITFALVGLAGVIVSSALRVLGALAGALFKVMGSAIGAAGALVGMRSVLTVGMIGALAGVAYGIYLLWQRSETFRESVSAFAAGFVSAWQQRMPSAARAFAAAVTGSLLPAILGLGRALGFNTWQQFAFWMGTLIPRALSYFLGVATYVVSAVATIIDYFSTKWSALNDVQKDNIKTMLQWAAASAGIILLANTFVAAILALFAPWQLLLIGLIAGFKFLWENSATFREGILAFGDAMTHLWVDRLSPAIEAFRASFSATFGAEGPAAIQRLKDALNNDLIPAFKALAAALGFETFEQFGSWLGGSFASLAVAAINGLTWSVRELAGGMQWLSEKMPEIKQHFEEFKEKIGNARDFIAGGGLAGPTGLLAAMSLLGPAGIVAAGGVGVLAAGFVSAYSESDTFRQKIKDFKDGFAEGWESKIQWPLRQLWSALVGDNGRGGISGALTDFFMAVGGGDAKEAGRQMSSFLEIAIKGVTQLVDGISLLIRGLAWMVVGFNLAASATGAFDLAVMQSWNWFADVYNLMAKLNNSVPFNPVQLPMAAKFSDADMTNVLSNTLNRKQLADSGAQYLQATALQLDEAKRARGFASGGRISGPGSKTSDSILARVSNREFVMKAAAVDYWGVNQMNAWNRMQPSQVSPARQSSATMGGREGDPVEVRVFIDGVEQRIDAKIDKNNQAVVNAGYTGRR